MQPELISAKEAYELVLAQTDTRIQKQYDVLCSRIQTAIAMNRLEVLFTDQKIHDENYHRLSNMGYKIHRDECDGFHGTKIDWSFK